MAFDKNKLNKSTFRGIPFYTRDEDVSGGQRLTDHKFINGGTKTESNGIENDVFKISAYIGGDDYLTQKEALREAFKNIDSGILIDKFYGEIEVCVDTWSIRESVKSIGEATIEVTFKLAENQIAEDASIVFTADARPQVLSNFQHDFDNKIGEDLLTKTSNNLNDFLDTIYEPIKFVQDKLGKIEAIKIQIGEMKSKIKTAILDVEELISDIKNLNTFFDDILDVSIFSKYEQKSFTNSLRAMAENADVLTSSNFAEEVVNAQTKLYIFTVVAGLTQTAISNLESITFETGDEFGSVKDDILTIYMILEKNIVPKSTIIEDIILKQELIDAYQLVRREFIEFYTQKYSGLQGLDSRDFVATTSVFLLTMDLYDDINRITEVLENNDIVDPVFISGTLLVLGR